MTEITISLPEERLDELKKLADRLHVSVEALVRTGIEEVLQRPDDRFEAALNRVLSKNSELYRRLA